MTSTDARRDWRWIRNGLAYWENEGGSVATVAARASSPHSPPGAHAVAAGSPVSHAIAASVQISDPHSLIIMRNSLLLLVPAMGLAAALSAIIAYQGF